MKYFLPGSLQQVRFDFANELKIGDVRYKHLTQLLIKVQLFMSEYHSMKCNYAQKCSVYELSAISKKVVE